LEEQRTLGSATNAFDHRPKKLTRRTDGRHPFSVRRRRIVSENRPLGAAALEKS
jgi:hypothetical protein